MLALIVIPLALPATRMPETVAVSAVVTPRIVLFDTVALACCIRAMERCAVGGDQTVLVVGAGPVGLTHSLILLSMKVRVAVSDVSTQRLEFARRLGVPFLLLECRTSEDVIRQRLERRVRKNGGVSDGRWEIYNGQLAEFEPPEEIVQAIMESVRHWTGSPELQDDMTLLLARRL